MWNETAGGLGPQARSVHDDRTTSTTDRARCAPLAVRLELRPDLGDICCANVVINALATGVACVAPGACGADAGTIVCGPGDDELCASQGHSCLSSTVTIVGWNICK